MSNTYRVTFSRIVMKMYATNRPLGWNTVRRGAAKQKVVASIINTHSENKYFYINITVVDIVL